MNRNLLLAFFASLAINLVLHNPIAVSILNSFSLSLVLFAINNKSSVLPLFAFIPLYYFAPRYLAISFLELFISLGLIFRFRIFLLWIPPIILCILLLGSIVNLPFSFDHERLILPTTEYKLAIKRQSDESLYLPYKLRDPFAVGFGTANSYLTNLFSFITIYNFSQTLLFAN